jgi:AraC-like DNA-binding protein
MQDRIGGSSVAHATDEPADPLDFVISLLRPQAVLSKIVNGGGQWSIRKPRYAGPSFCLILDGTCWLVPDGIGALELQKGDFLLLPETPSFVLASDRDIPPTATPIDTARDANYGGTGPTTMRMLGGYFRFDRQNAELVLRLLPPTVLVRRGEQGSSRLSRIVELIVEEADTHHRCRDLILERLVEVLLVEAWRFRAEEPLAGERGLIGGLSDPALANALRELHADPAAGWTVEKLARTAGMSRAVFAERFSRRVGMPPMRYLLEWRIAQAKELLRGDRPSLTEVANKVGYSSASAFSAAFLRVAGCSPAEYAKRFRNLSLEGA